MCIYLPCESAGGHRMQKVGPMCLIGSLQPASLTVVAGRPQDTWMTPFPLTATVHGMST